MSSEYKEIFASLAPFSSIVLLTNTTLASLYPQILERMQGYVQVPFHVVVVADGEDYKTLATYEFILYKLLNLDLDRSSLFISFGGGVIGDLGGFVAATFLRGIRFVQMPTSLLAMVDASVGGKVAVNMPQGKNLIGVFYPPNAVVTDLSLLRLLPEREFASGMAEVVKHAMIRDESYLQLLENNIVGIMGKEPSILIEMVSRSIAIKADVVESDEKELGERAILNFGHTIAHALEARQNYLGLRHGEAVAIGMISALLLSMDSFPLELESVERIVRLLDGFHLPIWSPTLIEDELLPLMLLDKKKEKGIVKFVLLEKIGKASFGHEVEEAKLRSILQRHFRKYAPDSRRHIV